MNHLRSSNERTKDGRVPSQVRWWVVRILNDLMATAQSFTVRDHWVGNQISNWTFFSNLMRITSTEHHSNQRRCRDFTKKWWFAFWSTQTNPLSKYPWLFKWLIHMTLFMSNYIHDSYPCMDYTCSQYLIRNLMSSFVTFTCSFQPIRNCLKMQKS